MKNYSISLLAVMILLSGVGDGDLFHKGQNPLELLDTNLPGLTPKIFAPGTVSTHLHEWGITFTPDSNTLFFTVRGREQSTIVSISFHNGQWGEPEVAPFSGYYDDSCPVMNLEGTKLFFTSLRPTYTRDDNEDRNIWIVERTKNGWEEPAPLSSDINLPDKHEMYPTVAPNGDLYFVSNRSDSRGRDDIYMARWKNGQFDYPENLGDNINSEYVDSCPYISPDGTYLIYEIVDKPGGLGGGDMYISFKQKDGNWGPSKHLGKEFNSSRHDCYPTLTPDQKYFLFVSTRIERLPRKKGITYTEIIEHGKLPGNGSFDICWVDAKVIEKFKPKRLK
ncbi:MAG: hypothetical protein V3V48_01005 [Candidatus Aminicenantaceae bacterium]